MYLHYSETVQRYLMYLLPIALLTGPFLPDLFISLGGILFLINSFLKKEYKYFNNTFFKIFISFYLFLLFNSLISDFVIFSLKSSLFYFRFGVFALLIWSLIDSNKNFIKYFTFFLLFAYCLAILNGVYQYIYSVNIFGHYVPPNRLLLLASDNAALGHYLARIFPLLIGLIYLRLKSSKIYYVLFFFLLISVDVLTFLSGERTSLALLLLSSVFILIFMKKLRALRLVTMCCSLLILTFISFLDPEIKNRNIDHTLNQIGISSNSEKIYIFSKLHDNYIRTSINMFTANPLVGIGVNNYRNLCNQDKFKIDQESCSTHPHNNYIQLISELGIFGLIYLIFIISYFILLMSKHIYSMYKNIESISDYQICLIACFLVTLWPLIPTLNLFNNWINILYFLPVGFYLQSLRSKQN